MFKIFKKIFTNSADARNEEKSNLANTLQQKAGGFVNFTKTKINEAKEEFFTIKYKMSNLLETNYQLGLKHLQNEKLSDAIFRFRFIKKFWPEFYEAYYQLAYCLALKGKSDDAKKVLQELLTKNPDFDNKATQLLAQINAENNNEIPSN